MATTVKAVLRPDKARADGTAPLWIRITANRKSRYLATGIYLDPKHWNKTKARVRKSHPLAPALNARLEEHVLDARTEALASPLPTLSKPPSPAPAVASPPTSKTTSATSIWPASTGNTRSTSRPSTRCATASANRSTGPTSIRKPSSDSNATCGEPSATTPTRPAKP